MTAGNEVRCLAFSEEGRENLSVVRKLTQEKGLKCVWVTPDETEKIMEFEEEVAYVIDPVKGSEEVNKVVEKLVNLKYPVLGPQCVLTQLKHGIRLKLDMKYPVYTLTMLGTVVCFTNILHNEREELMRLVELMGGKVSGPLDGSVTHLVAGEVGSVKYFTAASYGIKVMVKEWVHHLWKSGNSRYICAKDGKWEDFQCPIFLGCSICMTGFGTAEKTKVQKLVLKFGGEYSGAMKLNVTTHLLVNKPEGQKFMMAEKFGVKVVSLDWFYDSIEKRACQDSAKYPVKMNETAQAKPTLHQSTPEQSAQFMSLTDVSCIDPSTINETVGSTMNDTSMSTVGFLGRNPARLLSFPIRASYADVLDGLHVYLAGFSYQEEDKLGKLLSLAGAIKHTQLTSSVHRVVVGDLSRVSMAVKSEILAASSENPELDVVSHNWVLDSLTKGKVLPEKDYCQNSILPSVYEDTRSRPVSDDDISFNPITAVKKILPARPSTSGHDGSVLGYLLPDDEDETTMLSQYMSSHAVENPGFTELSEKADFNDDDTDTQLTHPQMEETTALQSTTMESDLNRDGCFYGKSFYVFGFGVEENQELISDIESNSGTVLAVDSKKIADYAVVPLTGWMIDKTANEITTVFWVKFSVEQGQIVDPAQHPMCTPFSVSPDVQPLDGCVTCLSRYRDSEQVYLTRLIIELGGVVQEIVARRDINEVKRTSHLIIHQPGGDKYEGCKNWGIPVVNENWVFECARKGRKVNEDDFIVGETVSLTNTVKKVCNPVVKVNTSVLREKKGHGYVGWDSEFPPMPRAPSVVNKIRERLEAKAALEKKTLEDAMKNKETPVGVRYKRLCLETPGKFMTKDANPGDISFDLTEVFELLKTPVEQQKKFHEEVKKNPGTPMTDIISRLMGEAVANIPKHLILNLEAKMIDPNSGSQEEPAQFEKENTTMMKQTASNIFEDLVISLATKLHKDYAELAKIITAHSGEFRWTYDKACTHFLFQGRLNDKNKEFCSAKKDGKFIVTPHWIEACVLAESRLDEAMFPHVYDPNKSIQVSTRSQRSSRRLTPQASRVSTKQSKSAISPPCEAAIKSKSVKESEDSQEGREILKRKLENIISDAAMAHDPQIRRLSCGRSNVLSPAQRRVSTVGPPVESIDKSKSVELSQDVQVSWDDPTGREEMLRLMNETNENDVIERKDEEISKEETVIDKAPSKMFFLMSSVPAQDKVRLSSIITDLGAEFLDAGFFDTRGTHLLVTKVGRSEKYLSALASGKHILKPAYLEDCKDAGEFMPEDAYEYGNPENPDTKNFLANPEALLSLIALAAFRWRKKLDVTEKATGCRRGAFAGWKVVLHVSDRQKQGFERLLRCGSAEMEENSIFSLGEAKDITHAFIDQERAKNLDQAIVEELVFRRGIHVCLPTFIGDYLLKDPFPDPKDYYLPQACLVMQNGTVEGTGAKRRRKQ